MPSGEAQPPFRILPPAGRPFEKSHTSGVPQDLTLDSMVSGSHWGTGIFSTASETFFFCGMQPTTTAKEKIAIDLNIIFISFALFVEG
jgi:hypothetical protein